MTDPIILKLLKEWYEARRAVLDAGHPLVGHEATPAMFGRLGNAEDDLMTFARHAIQREAP